MHCSHSFLDYGSTSLDGSQPQYWRLIESLNAWESSAVFQPVPEAINYTEMAHPPPKNTLSSEYHCEFHTTLNGTYVSLPPASVSVPSGIDIVASPELYLPADLRTLDAAWQNCSPGIYGVWDPPRSLNTVTALVPPTTKSISYTSSSEPAQPGMSIPNPLVNPTSTASLGTSTLVNQGPHPILDPGLAGLFTLPKLTSRSSVSHANQVSKDRGTSDTLSDTDPSPSERTPKSSLSQHSQDHDVGRVTSLKSSSHPTSAIYHGPGIAPLLPAPMPTSRPPSLHNGEETYNGTPGHRSSSNLYPKPLEHSHIRNVDAPSRASRTSNLLSQQDPLSQPSTNLERSQKLSISSSFSKGSRVFSSATSTQRSEGTKTKTVLDSGGPNHYVISSVSESMIIHSASKEQSGQTSKPIVISDITSASPTRVSSTSESTKLIAISDSTSTSSARVFDVSESTKPIIISTITSASFARVSNAGESTKSIVISDTTSVSLARNLNASESTKSIVISDTTSASPARVSSASESTKATPSTKSAASNGVGSSRRILLSFAIASIPLVKNIIQLMLL